MSDTEPNCYDCRYRGTIPGDAHSCCHHPAVGPLDNNPFGAMVEMLQGKTAKATEQLHITGHPQGIRRGWFLWPVNFDPTWLMTCDGFEAKAPKVQP